jgi:hypothetical protein
MVCPLQSGGCQRMRRKGDLCPVVLLNTDTSASSPVGVPGSLASVVQERLC